MKRHYIWDWGVRVFHWSLVTAFLANDLIIEDDSKLHIYVGYFVAALVLFRLLWGFVGSQYARFSSFPPSMAGAMEQVSEITLNRKKIHMGHTPLGALMIYNLLLFLALATLSGYLMTTDMFWGTEWTEELHEACIAWLEVSIVLHVLAVITETRRTGVNLPRAMLTGVKEIAVGEK